MNAADMTRSRDLTELLSSASVEVSSRGHQLAELRDHFAAGTDVTITFLPGDNYRHNVETRRSAAPRRLPSGPAHRRARNGVARGAR